jgi:hypothetical protein
MLISLICQRLRIGKTESAARRRISATACRARRRRGGDSDDACEARRQRDGGRRRRLPGGVVGAMVAFADALGARPGRRAGAESAVELPAVVDNRASRRPGVADVADVARFAHTALNRGAAMAAAMTRARGAAIHNPHSAGHRALITSFG